MTDFPEAPASVTYSITSKGGYNILFTVRAESGLELLDTMSAIEKKLTDKEYKPQIKQVFGQKKEIDYVPGKVCPKCGGKLVKKFTKENKEYHKCENSKYDFVTKTTSGCDYVDWLRPAVPAYNKNDPYKDGGISVEDYESR